MITKKLQKRFITDLDKCKDLWDTFFKPKNVSDLWEFRLCFHRYFNSEPCFLLLEDKNGIAGMLPLSYSEELDMHVFFPGEIWKGKTWLERTPVYLREKHFFEDLLLSCPERTYLRYMEIPSNTSLTCLYVDEIGYGLHPAILDFDPVLYHGRFSNKKIKQIRKVINSLTGADSTFHINRLEDFDLLANMSIQYFGPDSYLYDYRFREGLRDIMYLLLRKGLLHMVSLQINGETIAVDLGAFYEGIYTVFLGGTHPGYPGAAKAMNMYHIESACKKRLSKVDFLCGDFHWKKLWHLDPEPLYKFVDSAMVHEQEVDQTTTDDSYRSHDVCQISF